MRVALYVRVSTDRQQHAQTIQQQVTQLHSYVAAHAGWTVAAKHVFGDDGRSGAGCQSRSWYEGLARTRLRRRPGERVKYSNLGAGLLGQALAHAAGRPYEQLVRERICLPLNMPDTITPPASRPPPGWPPAIPAGEGRHPRSSSRPWPVPGHYAPRPPTCCACCGPTSTLPAPPWRPS
jgi:CubicO group peptidase (beta-lactamase class C family)